MKKLGMFALLGMLALPGMAKAGMCSDQVCVDKAFAKFESSVFKADGVYLKSINKAMSVFVVSNNEAQFNASLDAAGNKFLAALNNADAKFFAKTGMHTTGTEGLAATVAEVNNEAFGWSLEQLAVFGY